MSEVLYTNVFFIITAVAVVIFTIFLCVAMYFVIKILRTVRKIIDRVDSGSETIADDIAQLRSYVAEGSLFSHIVGLFVGTKTRRRKKTEDNN